MGLVAERLRELIRQICKVNDIEIIKGHGPDSSYSLSQRGVDLSDMATVLRIIPRDLENAVIKSEIPYFSQKYVAFLDNLQK